LSTAAPSSSPVRLAQREPGWVRAGLIAFVFLFVGIFLVVPVANVFYQAFESGWRAYVKNFVAAPAADDAAMSDEARDAQNEAAQIAAFNRDAI
jgi:ABC-type sulfate transport system permease subunit